VAARLVSVSYGVKFTPPPIFRSPAQSKESAAAILLEHQQKMPGSRDKVW
jgi:hypothetical protein